MRCENIIASTKKDFSILNMVTDSWIPACGVWVGDYPYLDRSAFREFVSTVEPTGLKQESTTEVPSDETSSESASRSETSRQSLDTDLVGSSTSGKSDRPVRKNPEEKLDGVLLRRDQYSSPKRRP